MATVSQCTGDDNHKGHICVLKREGLSELVERLTDNPAVSCANCGVEANSEALVCAPVRLR